ncbi:MAG: hydrogenase [Planctomycetes bacterium]|nr:hydrogenase [Planctomycetota bacterium]
MSLELTLGACGACALSGVFGFLSARRSPLGQTAAAAVMVIASAAGMVGALAAVIDGTTTTAAVRGVLPDWPFQVRLDPLSGFFLAPIFLLGIVGPVYGLGYWRQADHVRTGRRLGLCYGLLVAGLALVALSADGATFLFAWEIMALSAFFLVATEDHEREARYAGWVYLIAAHVGTLLLFALFAILRAATGSFELRRLAPEEAGLGLQTVIFLLAFAGFGLKAGMMPLHFWLPGAHASAPSHVSAILSAIVLKIGIYGLIRTSMLLPDLSIACGLLVLVSGVASAVFGVAFALGQHDLKRLLAYHSIENIGIILMGLGLAIVGAATRRSEWLVLGLSGCLLHVWNHCLFKALLFLAAGSVVHATHTREIDELGGLAKRMPLTAAMFAIGAAAICGLPPLNGFASEFLVYLGLFHAATDDSAAFSGVALAAPALALVGTLAVACFVKEFGAVFLGAPRAAHAAAAIEAPWSMIAPMALLAALCAAIGLCPLIVFPCLDGVLATWPGFSGPRLAELAPYPSMIALGAALVLAAGVGVLYVHRRSARARRAAVVTWDCGYLLPRATMQYTSSSFAAQLVGLYRWILRPRIQRAPPAGVFPGRSQFASHVPDVVLDGVLSPIWYRFKSRLAVLRVLQHGRVQRYIVYILVALCGLLLSLVPVMDLARKLVGK